MGLANHGWIGRHAIRVARVDGMAVVHFPRVTSQGGRVRNAIGDFFRKQYTHVRPAMDRFAVRIWIVGGNRNLDVDNVAKACLDALTGVLWHDDRQVDDLRVTRLPPPTGAAAGTALYLAAQPMEPAGTNDALDRLLARIDAL